MLTRKQSNQRRDIIVTTSWDDGHPLDFKVADLLAKYGVTGTFYVPISNSEHRVMNHQEILELSSSFEIGGHTVNHADLTKMGIAEAWREISEGKEILENIIDKAVSMFCYPRGRYNAQLKEQVKKAGFSGARSASWFHSAYPDDCYAMHPTLHVYPHSLTINAGHLLKEANFGGLIDYLFVKRAATRLTALSAAWLEKVIAEGGVLHLWGHSWEIDQFGLWGDLESILDRISSSKENILHLTNGEVVQRFKKDLNVVGI